MGPIGGARMKGMRIDMDARIRRTFSQNDAAEYLALSGQNALAEDQGRARVPGPLIAGLFSYLLGTRLPGRGTNYLKQSLEFTAPAYFGDELEASVRIVRLRPDKNLVNLETLCRDSDGRVVCRGEALVLAKDVKPR